MLMIDMKLWAEVMHVEVESRHEVKVWSRVHVWCGMRQLSKVEIGLSTQVRFVGKEVLLDEVILWGKVKMRSEVRV